MFHVSRLTFPMSIFNLHSTVLGDYRDFVRSFFTVADDRAREFIDREPVEQARLWPEALLQVSPSYARAASVDELADRGVILRKTAQIFRADRGSPFEILELNHLLVQRHAAVLLVPGDVRGRAGQGRGDGARAGGVDQRRIQSDV